MSALHPLFLWLPALAVGVHLIEEFVWPGGFPAWFRAYRPERAASVTTRFLVAVNVVLVGLTLLPPLLGPTPRAFALWLVVAAVGASNALFHLVATRRGGVYSPGVVTGTLVYLPLAALGVQALVLSGRVSVGTTVQAVVIGVAYPLWSAWTHRRRAAASRAI